MPKTPKGWTKKADRLARNFQFESFAQAMAFMVEVALFCDKTDHHPEWKNVYNKLSVELSTHDTGGVTAKDVRLAEHMNKVFGG